MEGIETDALGSSSEPDADRPAERKNTRINPIMSSSSSLFDCNICLDTASEPVVTACGHLYCWPCLYRWMHARPGENTCLCPICKLVLHEGNIIPIYGRGVDRGPATPTKQQQTGPCQPCSSSDAMVMTTEMLPASCGAATAAVPARPAIGVHQRRTAPPSPRLSPQRTSQSGPDNFLGAAMSDGSAQIGAGAFISSVFGIPNVFPSSGQEAVIGAALSPEQLQQAFLSRLLLILGSLVILCLLLI